MSYDGSFYSVASKTSIQKLPDESPLTIFKQIIFLNEEGKHFVREVYDILGVLGDLGGIFELSMIIFGFFLFPISEYSFYLKAAR